MKYNKDLKKVMILYPDLTIKSSSDYRDLVNIHNIAEKTFGPDLDFDLIKDAFNNRQSFKKLASANDYFYLLFVTASESRKIKKIAYPSPMYDDSLESEFDLQKWANLVYKIYDAVGSGDMDVESAVDYYAGSLDKKTQEDIKFKKWIKYYQRGEHKKYSEDNDNIKKNSFYGLVPAQTYSVENAVIPDDIINNVRSKNEKTEKYNNWRERLHTAIRRIDKLLRQSDDFIDLQSQKDLADILHQFDQEVRSVKQSVTASDLAMKYANKFKKLGFDTGYNEFVKYAQEAAPAEAPVRPAEPIAPTSEAPAATTEAPVAKEVETPEPAEPASSLEKALEPLKDEVKNQEYESLAGDVDLSDAVKKLEEIAGRLSDRRTIRLLAEFDIILDKIGIAPMFPELAEAQSKLIDAYSYALTRVTKMLGMLSSGKDLVEISDAKKKELVEKTMKEVNKTMEPSATEEAKKSPETVQKGLEGAGLKETEVAKPAPETTPAPEKP